MKMRNLIWTALALSAVTAASAQTLPLPSYIVQLKEPPASMYTGGVAGLAATKPPAGQRLNVGASDVQAYVRYVATKQNAVLAAMPSVRVLNRYDTVFNGFSAMLTEAQARQLKARSDVQSVRINEFRRLSTSYTPKFLGLDKPGGLWPQLGGPAGAGEDIVVGVIDTGIAPDNPAFADSVDANGVPSFSGTKVYGPPPARWKGTCETGPGFKATDCNGKVIGARIFKSTIQALIDAYPTLVFWGDSEFVSARDSEGHGSHTTSTAAGNHGVPATLNGGAFGNISGMAPRARIAVYKACFTFSIPMYGAAYTNVNVCPDSDSVAAVEQAVKDGVQVINFSVSGGTDTLTATDIAFLGATNAGVFVAAAAGNSGPSNAVNHAAPWLATIAASMHDRTFEGSARLGNGASYAGATINTVPLASSPLINASQAAAAGAAADDARQCAPGALDAARVAGRIVVCDRGVVALVDKSATVKAAGGVGMLLLNVSGGLTDTPVVVHSVPTLHVTLDKSAPIKAYAAQAGATASIGTATPAYGKVAAPVVADFSSRGPNLFDAGILKPDMAAPGAQILAAVAAVLTPAQYAAVSAGTATAVPTFNIYDGTSMATPHVAGVAALLLQKHPDWSPSAIKSALMTTATATKPDAYEGTLEAGTLPWGQGAGQIDPTAAADPGLVYRVPTGDYERYLCGTTDTSLDCTGVTPLKATDLNQPAITLVPVVGAASVTRSVTNVSTSPAVYTASGSLPGYTVTVTPSGLALAPGETKSFVVTVKASALLSDYAYGSLTWTDGQHVVRNPLTVFPKALAAPASLSSEAATGSKVFTLGTGFGGPFKVSPTLKASTLTTGLVTTGYVGGLCEDTEAVKTYFVKKEFTVPAGALAVSTEIVPEEYPPGTVFDVVIEILTGNYYSAYGPTGATILNPTPGMWRACAIVNNPPSGGVNVKLHTWVVMPGDAAGNLKAMAPSSATLGGTATVGLSWQKLLASERYLGVLDYQYNGASVGNTLLEITPAGSLSGSHMGISAPSSLDALRLKSGSTLDPKTRR